MRYAIIKAYTMQLYVVRSMPMNKHKCQNVVTISDLMEIENFRTKAKLINTKADLNKSVSNVTIMESPDLYDWVNGGEFVLTTWYAFSKFPELQNKAFKTLAKQISAIGIKTGRFINHVPDEIIKIANKNNLPIFEVSREVKFRELISTINAEIQDAQTNMLIEVEDYYQKLIRTSLSSDDIGHLINVAGNNIRLNCFCLDNMNHMIAVWKDKETHSKEVDNWLNLLKEKFPERISTPAGTVLEKLHIFDCYAHSFLIGTFIIVQEGALSEKNRLMGQQTASFLAIKLWDKYESTKKLRNRFWADIKSGTYFSEEDYEERLKRFDFTARDDFMLIVIPKNENAREIYNFLKYRFVEKLFVDEEVGKVGICHSSDFAAIKASLEKFIARFKQPARVVITPKFANAKHIKKYYELALQTTEVLLRMDIYGIRNAEEWLSINLLCRCRNTPEYEMIYENILSPLMQYDEKNQCNLLETLSMTLTSDGLEHIARHLHIHINTLRYRLKKVKEITNMNYFQCRDRYLLLISVLIVKLEGLDKGKLNMNKKNK